MVRKQTQSSSLLSNIVVFHGGNKSFESDLESIFYILVLVVMVISHQQLLYLVCVNFVLLFKNVYHLFCRYYT
jgi:hypothetical protein